MLSGKRKSKNDRCIQMIPGVINFVEKGLMYLVMCNGTGALYTFIKKSLSTYSSWCGGMSFGLGLGFALLSYILAYFSQDNFKDAVGFEDIEDFSNMQRSYSIGKSFKTYCIYTSSVSLILLMCGIFFIANDCKGNPWKHSEHIENTRK